MLRYIVNMLRPHHICNSLIKYSKFLLSSTSSPINLNYNHLEKTTIQYSEDNNLIVLHGLMGNLRNF